MTVADSETDLPQEADALYELPLEQFVAQRKAVAADLRRAGLRDDAARVSKLAKPTVAAWATNQLLRSQRAATRRLLDAGESLAGAQQAVLSGASDRSELQTAVQSHRAAIAELGKAARGLLDGEGHPLSEPVLERIGETLTAISLDPALREQAGAARFTKEQSFSGGFAAGEATTGAARRTAKRKAPRDEGAAAEKRLLAAERAEQSALQDEKKAARARDAARARLEQAEREHADARSALEAARTATQRARQAAARTGGRARRR